MGWYRNLKALLQEEPESWLAYLLGQQLHNRPNFIQKGPPYRGIVLQLLKYTVTLLRDLRFKRRIQLQRRTKFLVFAETVNQIRALEQTVVGLKHREEKIVSIVRRDLLGDIQRSMESIPFELSIIDVLRSTLLLVVRGPGLYRTLKEKHPVAISWYFSIFCSVYTYLAYFYRVLSKTAPDFVITSNDHNVSNRCLLAVAHHLKIKTVYMQHASVSSIFPALRVNYAFLDGQCALEAYLRCEPNQPETNRTAPLPEIILSGQKKQLKKIKKCNNTVVGVALNALDDPSAGIMFINALAEKGFNICLRWHPGQKGRDTRQYRSAFSKHQRVSLSDPKDETISEFLGKIGWLIAGNSSIHLEAALVDVVPIYYELTPADQPDYYGYVKHGLAKPAGSVVEVLRLLEERLGSDALNLEAVRYYSASYHTEWEGKEGELVAECLRCLDRGMVLPIDTFRISEFL